MNTLIFSPLEVGKLQLLLGKKELFVVIGQDKGSLVEVAEQRVGDPQKDRMVVWLQNKSDLSGFLQVCGISDTADLKANSDLEEAEALGFVLSKKMEISGWLMQEDNVSALAVDRLFLRAEGLLNMKKTTLINGNDQEFAKRIGRYAIICILGEIREAAAKKANGAAGATLDPRWVLWFKRPIESLSDLLDDIAQLGNSGDLLQALQHNPEDIAGFAISFGGGVADIILATDPINSIRMEEAFVKAIIA